MPQGATEEVPDGLADPLKQSWVGWHLDRGRLPWLTLGAAWTSQPLTLSHVLHPLSHGLSATLRLLSATLSWLSATLLASTPLLSATCRLLSASLRLPLSNGLGGGMFKAGFAAIGVSDIDLVLDWRLHASLIGAPGLITAPIGRACRRLRSLRWLCLPLASLRWLCLPLVRLGLC